MSEYKEIKINCDNIWEKVTPNEMIEKSIEVLREPMSDDTDLMKKIRAVAYAEISLCASEKLYIPVKRVGLIDYQYDTVSFDDEDKEYIPVFTNKENALLRSDKVLSGNLYEILKMIDIINETNEVCGIAIEPTRTCALAYTVKELKEKLEIFEKVVKDGFPIPEKTAEID